MVDFQKIISSEVFDKAELGDPVALFEMGKVAYEHGRYGWARVFLRGACEGGHKEACELLKKVS